MTGEHTIYAGFISFLRLMIAREKQQADSALNALRQMVIYALERKDVAQAMWYEERIAALSNEKRGLESCG